MGVSNAVRSTCFSQEPPASRKTGRAFNTFAASRAFGKPRKMAKGKIASLPTGETAPEALLCANRGHWGIEITHRNKDAILGEDCYTNRCGNAPRNIFSLIGIALNILKSTSPSPTRPFACSQVDPPRLLLNRPDMLILSMTMDRTDVIDGYGN